MVQAISVDVGDAEAVKVAMGAAVAKQGAVQVMGGVSRKRSSSSRSNQLLSGFCHCCSSRACGVLSFHCMAPVRVRSIVSLKGGIRAGSLPLTASCRNC